MHVDGALAGDLQGAEAKRRAGLEDGDAAGYLKQAMGAFPEASLAATELLALGFELAPEVKTPTTVASTRASPTRSPADANSSAPKPGSGPRAPCPAS